MKIQVKIEGQTFEVEVGDLSSRPILATVDGETYEVWPDETRATATLPPALATPTEPRSTPTPAPAPRPVQAFSSTGSSKVKTAPIPGTILTVSVQPGDSVNPGQELITLEAMKMKNIIRADIAGKIAAVLVKPGDRVSQGQPLIEFSD